MLALIAVITGCYFPLAFYATSGLETPFYLLLLVIGVYCHLRARTDDRPRLHSVSIVALSLAALTRPEGLAFLLITAMVVVRVGDRSARLTAVLAVIAYAIVVLAKYDYYGTWLPNTYLAKPGLSLHYGAPIVRGLQYLARFLIKSGLILVVPIAVLRPKQPRARMVWKYLWTFVLVQLGFIVFVGGDVLRFDRFTVPMLPWILALAGLALRDRLPAGTALIRSRTGKAAVVVAVTVIALNVAQAIRANSKYCVHDWMHATAHRSVGRMVGQMAPDARAIVTNEIGAVRYYSRIPVIDMLGLTDATVSAIRFQSFQDHGIGSSAASVEAVCSYLLARRPDVILLPSTRRLNTEQRNVHRDTMHPLWYGLFAHERFVDDYEPAAVVRIRHDKFIYIFLRNDIPANTPAIPGPDQCFEVEPLS